MNRFLLLVPVAVALVGGCGGQPPAERDAAQQVAAADSNGGTLIVEQDGRRPQHTAWYVRIETTAATTVREAAFPVADIALTEQLPAGQYRVISWHRPCSGPCPSSGERGLGPLAEVCGTKVTLKADTRVTATVRIAADGRCSVDA